MASRLDLFGGIMSWQKCPKCSGTGNDISNPYSHSSGCFICNGYGVINEQTGEPLYKTVTSTTISLDGFPYDPSNNQTGGKVKT